MALVYLLRNPLKIDASGKPKVFYVGLSVHDNVAGRPKAHLKEAKAVDGYNPHKNRTINLITEAGLEPVIEIVDIAISKEQACELEIFLIAFFGRKAYDNGGVLCNITKGGDGNTSDRTPEDIEFLKQIGQDRWDSMPEEDRKAHGAVMKAGLAEKLKDPEFRKSYSESMRQTALNRPDLKEVARKARASISEESYRLGRKKSAEAQRGQTRDRCSCLLCHKETAYNSLMANHGEGKCTGDRSLLKDTTGNKGKYERSRACCMICRMETISARLMVHLKKTHGL